MSEKSVILAAVILTVHPAVCTRAGPASEKFKVDPGEMSLCSAQVGAKIDLATFVEHWLWVAAPGSDDYDDADVTKDGVVNFRDFAAFASGPCGKGRVIEMGWDMPTIPWLCDNLAAAEATPFHGIILDLAQRPGQGGLSWIAWATDSIPFDVRQNAEEDIELLNDANFIRLRENSFFRLNSSGWSAAPDWFDADFNTVVSNVTFMASAVNQTALAGIAFDPEDYFSNCWHYPSRKYSAIKSFEQYQAQVRQRGREMASAIKSACPGDDFTLLFLFANSLPYISTQWWGHPLAEDSYGLLPAFIDGLLDEACEQIRVIDGIESAYPNKTVAQFQGSISNYQGGSSLSADPSRYLSCVGIGFGTWMDYRSNDLGWYTNPDEFDLNHFTPETFNQAMDISTDLAELSWVYTQIPNWYLEDVPEAYFDALADVTGLPAATPCMELWARCLNMIKAKQPFPANGAENVHPEVLLSWEAGIKAALHDVYFGTDLTVVSDANTAETRDVYIGTQPLADTNYYPGPLELGRTYYWRIDEVNDGNLWEGYVWRFTVDDGKAGNPSPAHGSTGISANTSLSWTAGMVAASHDVFLGTDYDAVNNATTLSAEYKANKPLGSESYDPGGLDLGTNYCWRIDEVNPGYEDTKGDIWSFSTIQYRVVDDMESYCEGPGCEDEIWDTWKDYWANGTGALVSLGTVPDEPVHGGSQSMSFDYYNDPLYKSYSEAARGFEEPCNWAGAGVEVLSLYFYGLPGNDLEPMYVGLEDTTSANSISSYSSDGHDINDIKVSEWQQWFLDLGPFGDDGVDLSDVNRIRLGFGDPENPVPGGAGMVYFDDLAVYKPVCRTTETVAADFTKDCIVNYLDVRAMAAEWLTTGMYTDLIDDDNVNFKDYAALADDWLKEFLWL